MIYIFKEIKLFINREDFSQNMKALKKILLKLNNKAQVTFGNLTSIIIVLGIAAVVGVVIGILLQDIRDTQTLAGEAARNVSEGGLDFLNNISNQFGLLGTVIGLVLVVSVVIAVFRFRGGGVGGGGGV